MDIPSIDSFPHNQVIAKSKINVNDLDDDIKVMMADFNKRYSGYKLKWSEANSKVLMATSNVLCQKIVDYYVEDEDQNVDINPASDLTPKDIKDIVKDIKDANDPAPAPAADPKPKAGDPAPGANPAPNPAPAANPDPIVPPADEEPKNKNEKILHDLFKAGTTSVTRNELSLLGLNMELVSIRGGKVGKYELKKEPSELTYKLSKI